MQGSFLTQVRDDVSYFRAIRSALNKKSGTSAKTPEQVEAAIRQLVSMAITTDGQAIDVFTAAGLQKPDISILSDQFLAEVRGLPHTRFTAFPPARTELGKFMGTTSSTTARTIPGPSCMPRPVVSKFVGAFRFRSVQSIHRRSRW